MGFLKKLFGGGGTGMSGDPNGLYFYVKPRGCEEVVRVRIDRNNDLSLADDGSAYFVHKHVRGIKCRQAVEMDMYFNANRSLVNSELQGGEMVEKADWDAWQAARAEAEAQDES
jgi:hypothetical protein